MTISFNTSAGAGIAAVIQSTTLSLTIPAGVLTGDLMILAINTFTFSGNTGQSISISGGGGAWTALGSSPYDSGAQGGTHTYGNFFKRVATAGDPGATLTITNTGGSVGGTNQFWTTAVISAYTGASDVDVAINSTGVQPATSTIATPSGTTNFNNEWAVYAGAISVNSSGLVTGIPNSATSRTNQHNSGVETVIADSNGSVGNAGASIGGGNYTVNNGENWWSVFTLSIKPPGVTDTATASLNVTPTLTAAMQRIAHGSIGLSLNPVFFASLRNLSVKSAPDCFYPFNQQVTPNFNGSFYPPS